MEISNNDSNLLLAFLTISAAPPTISNSHQAKQFTKQPESHVPLPFHLNYRQPSFSSLPDGYHLNPDTSQRMRETLIQ
jgi:hypothetical protein